MGKEKRGKPNEECERGEIEYVDGDVAKAMAHPLRIQIVAALNQQVMSPSMFAKKTDSSSRTSPTTSGCFGRKV